MSIFDYNYEKFLEEGAKENVGLATLNQLNKFQKEYFKPRFGPFNLGDAVGILKNNPYSMALTGITAALNPKIFGAKGSEPAPPPTPEPQKDSKPDISINIDGDDW